MRQSLCPCKESKWPNHRIHALKAKALPSGSDCGRGFSSVFHHQNLTPNPSRLGVSISASRKPRGVRAYSACAGGVHGLGRRAAGLTLFCPLFSQNLHQLFRGGTRSLRCSSNTYARAIGSGLLACLHEQNCRANTQGGEANPRVTPWVETDRRRSCCAHGSVRLVPG